MDVKIIEIFFMLVFIGLSIVLFEAFKKEFTPKKTEDPDYEYVYLKEKMTSKVYVHKLIFAAFAAILPALWSTVFAHKFLYKVDLWDTLVGISAYYSLCVIVAIVYHFKAANDISSRK